MGKANSSSAADDTTRVLHVRVKDRFDKVLTPMSREVNFVWNYANDLGFKVWQRERRFMSGFDFSVYTAGASKEGLGIGSEVFQEICEEFAKKRKAAGKVKLKWRVSNQKRANRSLGWVPFKTRILKLSKSSKGKTQVVFQGHKIEVWDSYGLENYTLGAGNFSQDAEGNWFLNICVTTKKKPAIRVPLAAGAIGIDLGLKSLMADSDGNSVAAPQFYRDLELALGVAQRANKKPRVRAIHAKIANRRKDFLHKHSTALVQTHCAIFVGDVNAQALTQTRMAKSVLDAGWSTFRTMLKYKCDDAGVWFKVVDEAFSTQECHKCHARTGPKGLTGLDTRTWTCSACGTTHDRDTNSATVIKNRGLDWLEKEFSTADSRGAGPEVVVNEAFEHWRLAGLKAAPGHGRPVGGIIFQAKLGG